MSTVLALGSSANGRVSGKSWKGATRRSLLPEGLKTSWDVRMQKTQKALAIKKLESDLKDEKLAEIKRRRDVTIARKKAAEDRRQREEQVAKMGARKADRRRRRAGRSKQINH